MYRQAEHSSQLPEDFEIGQEYKLSPNNRWVIMAQLIPWAEFEGEYAQNFDGEMGAPAKPFRMALGALIIKEKLGTSDRETVEQIRENPYLQYFIGRIIDSPGGDATRTTLRVESTTGRSQTKNLSKAS